MNKMKTRIYAFVTAGAVVLGSAGAAVPALAANGVQDGTQTYDSKTDGGGWSGDTKGDIDLTYDTSNGQWEDPGDDPEKPDDNGKHKNGTFTVTIPTAITYEDMAIGSVNTSDDYTVTVRGAIDSGKTVTLSAETGKTLSTASGDTGITETTKQGKTTWIVDECYGGLNTDGSLKGTSTTDNITMTGTAKAAGVYTGTVAYKATLN